MNIWDSVQRGLEKATLEATRRARTLRLRSTIDNLTQQIHTQEDDLLVKTMEIFSAGQLTQSELLPLCQELLHLQQQLDQAQHELNMVQSQNQTQFPPTASGMTPTVPAYTTPPSDYQPYDQTVPAPPPPPEVSPLSSFNTVIMNSPDAEKQLCTQCHAQLIPDDAYCHNCGTPIGRSEITQQPTLLVEAAEEVNVVIPPASSEKPEVPLTRETSEPDNPIHSEKKDGGS